ncbi:MAG: MBL fold metallo-hydrolase [Bdellovibrionales bacterium]|nr:MBL fold metallo-hydrolase [Bdellovibrionales bacterium]
MSTTCLFRQLFDPETSTYTYLLADPVSREAAIIDSVREWAARDLKLIQELGLRLKYILETHVHADHITGAEELRKATGAQTAVSAAAGISCADLALREGDTLRLGGTLEIRVIGTPGHTDGCTSYVCAGRVFTGDSLLIRSAGRTDFQQGNPALLYKSIHKLYALPDETVVCPAHDYQGRLASTIGEEKAFNERIAVSRSEADFVALMRGLKLSNPKKINEAVPANMACGKSLA